MENGTNINSINYITFRTTLFMKIVLLKEMSLRKICLKKKDERKKKSCIWKTAFAIFLFRKVKKIYEITF